MFVFGLFTWHWNRLLSHGVKRLGNIDLGLEKAVYASVVYTVAFHLLGFYVFQKFGIYFFMSDLLRDIENDPLTTCQDYEKIRDRVRIIL